jgi:hypothetical protein
MHLALGKNLCMPRNEKLTSIHELFSTVVATLVHQKINKSRYLEEPVWPQPSKNLNTLIVQEYV